MLYLIQSNVYKEPNYYKLLEAVEKLGLDHDIIDTTKFREVFVDTFDYETDRKDIFIFGSVKLARLAAKHTDWHPGAIFGINTDFKIHQEKWGTAMLNYDSELIKFFDPITSWDTNDPYKAKFIRPSEDSKILTGKLYCKAEWDDLIYEKRNSGHVYSKPLEEVELQVSTPKQIYWEARCFVVNKKIITSSFYKFGSGYGFNHPIPEAALDFAQELINTWQPHACFVLDICETPNGYKCVETNSIACAGFYDINIEKLLIALEDFYNPIT